MQSMCEYSITLLEVIVSELLRIKGGWGWIECV